MPAVERTGGRLIVSALESAGISHCFGVPGESFLGVLDALYDSPIEVVSTRHEGGASFMADAVGRLSDSIGVLTVVPAAGLTHAASGIGEAFLDGVPMLVLSGGPRTDTGHRYQLHQMDTHKFMSGLTKATFRVTRHEEVVPTLFKAYEIATSGEPGPVFVELPVNILLLMDEIGELDSSLQAKLPYDTLKDFVSVAYLGASPAMVMVVGKDVPAKTPQDEGYFVARGTLTRFSTDTNKNVSSQSRQVEFKSFPRDAPPAH